MKKSKYSDYFPLISQIYWIYLKVNSMRLLLPKPFTTA